MTISPSSVVSKVISPRISSTKVMVLPGFFRRTTSVISPGVSLLSSFERYAMDVFAFGLAAKLVPRESKPCEVVEVGILILPLASGGIGVFGTEDDFSAMFFRKEIIEKERTDIADMHIPGRAGRHAHHYFFFFVIAHVRDRCRRVVSQAFVRRRPVRTRAPLCSCALAMRGRS